MPDSPSILWRRLGATSSLIFGGSNSAGNHLTDDRTSRVTITRGGAISGLTANTAQFDAPLTSATTYAPLAWPMAERRPVWLSEHALDRIDALAPGGPTREQIKHRFYGAPSSAVINDTGDKASDWRVDVVLADALTFLRSRDQGALSTRLRNLRGSRLDQLVASALARAFPTAFLDEDARLTTHGATETWHAVRHSIDTDPDPLPITTGELLNYLEQCGHLLRVTRDGTPQLLSHSEIVARGEALAAMADPPLLLRAGVLSPVQWHAGPGRALSYRVTTINEFDGPQTFTVDPAGASSTMATRQDVDLSRLVGFALAGAPTAGPYFAQQARVYRESPPRWRVERVTVDVAKLLTDPRAGMPALARRLLALEAGDPVILGRDWPFSAVYYVTRITEQLTARGWTLGLDLEPFELVAGKASPAVPAGATIDTRWTRSTTYDTVPDTDWNNA